MRKESFLKQRKSKLQSLEDSQFQVLERINDNAYKLDFFVEYNVSATFNVSNLSLFDVSTDLRWNTFEEEKNVVIQTTSTSPSKDPMIFKDGPMTRSRAKRVKKAMRLLVQGTMNEMLMIASKGKKFNAGLGRRNEMEQLNPGDGRRP